jgi:hypothetical protein
MHAMFSKLEKVNKMVEDYYRKIEVMIEDYCTKTEVMVEDHCTKIEEIVEGRCRKMKEMGIKMLLPIQEYVNDNDVSIEGIQYERVNEDLTNVSNSQITECEREDRVMNSRIDSCLAMSSNQNKIEKESVKITENGIEDNRKEEIVITVDRVNQLIAPF